MTKLSAEKMEDSVNAESVTNGGGLVNAEKEPEDTLSPTDLSELLAAGTKEVHEKAENTQFVKDFLRGRIRKELFKLGDVALYYTYEAMEEEIERNKDHPDFSPLYFPELNRRDALARDLDYFYGEDWRERVSCSPATQRYVERIHQVGQEEPVLLVAHAYTRYMGDLSGGQVLKKVAQRALKLPATGEGVYFYQFDGIHSAKAFKQLYRSRMNELELDMATKDRLVAEAVLAFQFNMEVFDELEEMGKDIQEEVMDAGMPVHGAHGTGGDLNKCPYYAAQMVAGGGSAYVGQLAMAVLRHPTGQVLFAAWVAALAGLAAWYFM
ncbi:heme oxygenase 2 [Coregonus clupeaformis]|uniref:heme oxygenase 2 n=1 Tax=Coregonus clupeaformis TaxID=59861 RepID=UPI001E1C5325|nr:heme oxygenase 2 [Coregonus clupeaformis]XP_041720171.2 heme oxygenase 2 [Coregonus clupeaformis]XP_041720172.2 heme oxygenase 2 [Coregonus clupeaformis]XP_041720173.2 heme oxygenase 2 [Coregonus clupeaformis]